MSANKVKLEYILNSTDELPQFPLIAMQIFNLCSNPDTDHKELEKLVKSDAGLVTKLLRLVNSSKFGFSKKIDTITQVIGILGLNGIKEAALLSSVGSIFNGKAGEVLWKHSVGASVSAQEVFKHHQKALSEIQFISVLLHNIGRAILMQHFNDQYESFLEARSYDDLLKKEKMIFSKDHREIGAIVASKWNLPQNIIDGIEGKYDLIGDDYLLKTSLDLTYFSEDDISKSLQYKAYTQLKETITEKTLDQIAAVSN